MKGVELTSTGFATQDPLFLWEMHIPTAGASHGMDGAVGWGLARPLQSCGLPISPLASPEGHRVCGMGILFLLGLQIGMV